MIEPERDPELTLEQRYQREVDTRKRMQSELQQLLGLVKVKDAALHVAMNYIDLLNENPLADLIHARIAEALFSKPHITDETRDTKGS